jgi:hypothetical protein
MPTNQVVAIGLGVAIGVTLFTWKLRRNFALLPEVRQISRLVASGDDNK